MYYSWRFYSSELYHHGIKGQKWGVRRYQNLDRSLTPAGKERYGRGAGDKIKSAVTTVGRTVGNAGKAIGSKISESYKKKHPEKMSDTELKAYISRLQMEKQYKQLREDLTPKKEHKIRKRIAGILDRGIDTVTNRAWQELANNLFEKPDIVSDPYKIANDPKATDKEVKAARERVINLDLIRKQQDQDRHYDPNNIPSTSSMTSRELDNYITWEDRRKKADAALKETDEYKVGRTAVDRWLETRDAHNREPSHYVSKEDDKK